MSADDPVVEIFLEEARELIEEVEQGLLALEDQPDDLEVINRIFRAAHTLKGNSRMLGFDVVGAFTHDLETLLDRVRKGKKEATRETIDVLLRARDVLAELIEEAAGHGVHDPAQLDEVTGRIRELAKSIVPPANNAAAAKVDGAAEDAPAQPEAAADVRVDAAGPPAKPAAVPNLSLSNPPSDLPNSVRLSSLPASPKQEQAPKPADAPGPKKVGADHIIPKIVMPSGEVTIKSQAPQASGSPGMPRDSMAPSKSIAARPNDGASSIRVSTEKIDRLVNLVGELVIGQSMVSQLVHDMPQSQAQSFEAAVVQVERYCRELQECVLGIRMLPLKTVFSRCQRIVRDTAGAAGKQVRLVIEGEETELDKTVLERLGDSLTHLLRNAVDHGVESPDKREAKGKPREGVVRLVGYQTGSTICIEISDDGNGIAREKILAKAQANGLVSGSGEHLSDEDVFQYIFHPGFSTAEAVTEISGRGVGMDVVKRSIDALKGSISISSELGKGTLFRIRLPLTLAILDGLAVRVGQSKYIVPLLSVVECVRPTPGDVRSIPNCGEIIDLRGELLPLVRLYEVFTTPPEHTAPEKGIVVVLDDGGVRQALLADELIGQFQVVIKSLEDNYRDIAGIAGATILGDGSVALIVDVTGLANLPRRSLAGAA